ncbi:MAG: peptidylprolyl isomerase [Myxococcota bacterium]
MRPALNRLALTVALFLAPRGAEAQLLEQVVAFVNDEPIFLSELRERTDADSLHGEALQDAYREALRSLVDERLIAQRAEQAEITVTEGEVDDAIAEIRRRNGLDPEAFWQAVVRQGLNREGYLHSIRVRLLRIKLLRQEAESSVSYSDLQRAWEEELRQPPMDHQVRIAQIICAPENGTPSARRNARRRARELRRQLQSGQLSFDAAVNRERGGNAGWVRPADIEPRLWEALRGVEEGELSEVVETDAGFHILLLQGERHREPATFESRRHALRTAIVNRRVDEQEEAILQRYRDEAYIAIRLRDR